MSQLVDFATVDLFPTLKVFSVVALKWTDLEECVVHQIASARTVNTQHGSVYCLVSTKSPFFQNSDPNFEFLGIFSINLQIFVEKDGKNRQGNNFMYFHFCMKNIGNSHLFLILD